MNFLVYEMRSIQDLRGEDRVWVQDLAERLRRQPAQPGSPYVPYFEALGAGYFKKRKENQRLLVRRLDLTTSFGLVPVVVFLELFSRADPRYANGKVEKLSPRFDPLLTARHEDIREWAEKLLEKQGSVLAPPLPDMPESLSALLQPIPFEEKGAGIFQSPQWNKLFQEVSSSQHKSHLHDALVGLVSTPHAAWERYEYSHRDVVIHYVTLPELGGHSCHYYLLGFTLSTWKPGQRDAIIQRINESWLKLQEEVILPLQLALEGAQSPSPRLSQLFIDCVSRFASCAYPSYLLADAELWEKLITTDSMLLPLSSEELHALERLFSGDRFPAIIEGRAGSGKTTLLSYYVPERLVRLPVDIQEPAGKGHRLLYLAENPRLLRNAQEIVNRLKDKLKEEYQVSSLWLHEEYKTFHSYAIHQLPIEHRGRFWDMSKGHISFFRFRSLLRHPHHGLHVRLSRAVQNPEILWFVIRSYIKGFNLSAEGDERWMTPKQFATEEELSRRDRQVSQEAYEEVWEKVWPWYRRLTIPCSDNNFDPPYWDNLDLAWEVLNYRWSEAPSYGVLICDEVQDLTRVELAAIFQSSEFLNYYREPNQASRVPIVLAGDSYQTINPACFRWARVKADCAKALIQQIPNATPPRIEPFQLLYNYRNRPSIARLCNALQLLRQEVVGVTGELQRIWQPEDQPLNQAVRRLQIPAEEREPGAFLRDLFCKGVSFLGPEPAPTGSDDYVAGFWRELGLPEGPPPTIARQTPTTPFQVSSDMLAQLDDVGTSPNYDCPADVKGLEKPFYALLGFGTAFAQLGLNRFWQWDDHCREFEIPEAQLLAAEYFLNRLYVSASRAREQLWIVETEEGWNAFWKPLEEWVARKKSAGESGSRPGDPAEHSRSDFDFSWSAGSADELVRVCRKEWPRLAREYEEQAEATWNAGLAERAAYYYGLAGDAIGERRCLALMEYIRGNISTAIRTLIPIDVQKALRWAWEAAAWEELVLPEFESTWQFEVAELMQKPPSHRGNAWVTSMGQLIRRNHAGIAEDIAHIRKSWKTWSIVMTELLERAAQGQLDEHPARLAMEIGQEWQNSPHHDLSRYCKALGQIEYGLGNFREAVTLWEKARHTQHQEYYLAKGQVAPYPNNLQYLESAQQWQEILHQEESHPNRPLSPQDSRRVLRACRKLCRWRQALKTAIALENHDFVEVWGQIIADTTIKVTDLREYMQQAYAFWCQSNAQTDKADNIRSWSLLILDCLLALQDLRAENKSPGPSPATTSPMRPEQIDREYGPLFLGLAQECDVRRIAGHFQRVWENREEWPRRWKTHESLLKIIGPAGLFHARQSWKTNRFEETATVTHLLCRLVWQTSERKEDEELGGWFDQLVPYGYIARSSEDQTAADNHKDERQRSLVVNLLENEINPQFSELVQATIQLVAEAPADLFRNLQGLQWRDFHDLLDGLANLLYRKVQDWLGTGPEMQIINQSEEFLVIGRICEQANFRKLAVKYYDTLAQATERIQFSEDFRRTVSERQKQARQAQRELREQRDAGREEAYIRPGDKGRSATTLAIRSLRQEPTVILELLPDSYCYQVRFTVDREQREHVTAIEPVRISRPRGSSPVEWEISVPTGEKYRLIWHRSEGRLRVEAPDKVFVIDLAVQNPRQG
jgi:hypothetical protein